VGLIAMVCMAAFRELGAKYADIARHQGQTIASLSWDGHGSGAASPAVTIAPPKPKGQSIWDQIARFFLDLTPIGDIITLLDPNASAADKALAGVGLFASFIPGIGQVGKAGLAAAKAGKNIAKAGEAANDVKKGSEGVDVIAGAAKKDSKDAKPEAGANPSRAESRSEPKSRDEPEAKNGECANGACKNGTCFAAGTPVHTADGLRPIEEVREGDLVWSRDDETDEVQLQRVLHRFVTPDRVILRIDLQDDFGAVDRLQVTPPHPFWTQRGWVAAQDLTFEDDLTLLSNQHARVVGAETLDEGTTVYNFEVEAFHTYFVGEAGAWVHNTTPEPAACPAAKAPEPDPGLTPEQIDTRMTELAGGGHGPQRHGPGVTDAQLKDRVEQGFDPMTGSKVDGVNPTQTHLSGKHATRVNTAEDYVKAEKTSRADPDFARQEAANAASGGDRIVVETPLEKIYGSGYEAHVSGRTRNGSNKYPTGNPPGSLPSTVTNFEDGHMTAVYKKKADGTYELLTMYPGPKP
jgi:hypothetical protein